MTSYQRLKAKCEYLQSQIDIFKGALTVVRQEPQMVEDISKDSLSYAVKMQYAIIENEINEEMKKRLNHWVVENLDKKTIMRFLEEKKRLKNNEKIFE